MVADYLSNSGYGATRDLDRELGFGSEYVADPFSFQARDRQAAQRSTQAAQGLADQSRLTGGRDSGQRPNGWVNPALNQPSFAPTNSPDAPSTQTGAMWQAPQRAGADYSTAGQAQQPRVDDLAKYGGFYNGGKWNAYSGPTGGTANDRPQQFFDSTAAGRGNYQDYLGVLQRNNADFQAKQKLERQQRLRGSLLTNSASLNRRTGLTDLRTSGRAPTETELEYA